MRKIISIMLVLSIVVSLFVTIPIAVNAEEDIVNTDSFDNCFIECLLELKNNESGGIYTGDFILNTENGIYMPDNENNGYLCLQNETGIKNITNQKISLIIQYNDEIFYSVNNALYTIEQEKVCELKSNITSLFVAYDYLFVGTEDEVYIMEDSQELNLFYPGGLQQIYADNDKIFTLENSVLLYTDERDMINVISENVDTFSAIGQWLFFCRDNIVYKYDLTNGSVEVLLSEYARNIYIENEVDLYYINGENSIIYRNISTECDENNQQLKEDSYETGYYDINKFKVVDGQMYVDYIDNPYAINLFSSKGSARDAINAIKSKYPSGSSYFTDNGYGCNDHGSNCSYTVESQCNCKIFGNAIQCKGFAGYVFYQLFDVNLPAYDSSRYKLYYNAYVKSVGILDDGSVTASSLRNLFSSALPGDEIQGRSQYSQHSMMLIRWCTVTVTAEDTCISGDINGDGVVGTKDVTVLRRYIAGGYDVTVVDEVLDVNGDGEITTKDVTVLRRFIAGGYGVELN